MHSPNWTLLNNYQGKLFMLKVDCQMKCKIGKFANFLELKVNKNAAKTDQK